jgi:hypothetical protein
MSLILVQEGFVRSAMPENKKRPRVRLPTKEGSDRKLLAPEIEVPPS